MCAVKHSWTEIYEARHRERRVARGSGIAGVRGGEGGRIVRRGCVVGEPSARREGREKRGSVGGEATRIYGTGETIGITPFTHPLAALSSRSPLCSFPLPARGPQARNDRSRGGLAPPTREKRCWNYPPARGGRKEEIKIENGREGERKKGREKTGGGLVTRDVNIRLCD